MEVLLKHAPPSPSPNPLVRAATVLAATGALGGCYVSGPLDAAPADEAERAAVAPGPPDEREAASEDPGEAARSEPGSGPTPQGPRAPEGDARLDPDDGVNEAGTSFTLAPAEGIFFGEIGYGAEAVQQLTVTSSGDEALRLVAVAAEAPGATGISVAGPATPLSLPPGQSATFDVWFRPGDGLELPVRRVAAAVVVHARGLPSRRLDLWGIASHEPELCLAFEPDAVELGFSAPGDSASADVQLVNCGREELRVAELVLEPPLDRVVVGWDGAPFDLPVGGARSLTVIHRPADLSPAKARLVARTAIGLRALAQVRSVPPPCPSAAGGASVGDEPPAGHAVVTVGSRVRLDGRASADATPELELAYAWRLEAPEESAGPDLLPGADAAEVTFVPDVPGRYLATLEVWSEATGQAGCEPLRVTVEALPRTTLRVSLTWEDAADLDLYVTRSEADGEQFADHAGPEADADQRCGPTGCSPDWGRPGVDADDPRHLGDDTDGFGPEVVELPVLEADRSYRVGIRYTQPGRHATVVANVSVELPGGLEARVARLLWQHGAFWIPFVVDGDGEVRLVDEASLR